jgi:putative transposon-encoded protein
VGVLVEGGSVCGELAERRLGVTLELPCKHVTPAGSGAMVIEPALRRLKACATELPCKHVTPVGSGAMAIGSALRRLKACATELPCKHVTPRVVGERCVLSEGDPDRWGSPSGSSALRL